jgi:hypothetical protein
MRTFPASPAACSLALALMLGSGLGCYPDSDKIRNQVAQKTDASPTPQLDTLPPMQLDSFSGPEPSAELPAPDVTVQPDLPKQDVLADVAPDVAPDLAPDVAEVSGPDLPDAPDALLPDRPADLPADRAVADVAPEAAKPDSPADSGASVDERCKAYAQGFCKTYQSCAAGSFAGQYTTQEVCTTRIQQGCMIWAVLPGTNWPTAQCASALGIQACKDFLDDLDPVECLAPGLNPDGANCYDEAQCQGRRCSFYSGMTCGICNQRSAAGGTCNNDTGCLRGLRCGSGHCVTPGSAGATCDDAHPCASSLHCTTAGKCIERLLEGATCDINSVYDECDWRSTSVRCSPVSKKCVKSSTSELSCGYDKATDTIKTCSGGRDCSSSMCLPLPGIGDHCDDSNGPSCLYPQYCESTASTCQLPVPDATCGA